MVVEQYPYIDESGKEYPNLIRHYSDKQLMIQKVGTEEIYSDAVDLYPTKNEYIETDIPIEPNEDEKS